jgi:riboflavin-specific deaminase-like protein
MEGVRAPEFPEGRPWLRAVMAMTLDGVMRGADGGSRSISSPADQRWFSALRSDPDVLLVGAGTIRAEDYRPSRKVIAVVSRSLDLPLSLRMFRDRGPEHPRPLVLTTEAAAEQAPGELREAAEVIACGVDAVDLSLAVASLHDRGLAHVQCEGGPALLSDLLSEGLVDELLLSVTPLLLGGAAPDHVVSRQGGWQPPVRMRVQDLQQDEGTAFLTLVRH